MGVAMEEAGDAKLLLDPQGSDEVFPGTDFRREAFGPAVVEQLLEGVGVLHGDESRQAMAEPGNVRHEAEAPGRAV